MAELQHLDLNILYIEDENDVRESIQRVLELISNKVYVASNGQEALNYFDEGKIIDIIVTDIRMPQMNGLELIQNLREKNLDVPVIITTAFNEVEYLKEAIELKVEKFIHKPIDVQELLEDIKKLATIIFNQKELQRKKAQLENYRQAIRLTNYIVEFTPSGKILTISQNLQEYFLKNFSPELHLTDLIKLIPKDFLVTLLEKVKKLEFYTKDITLHVEDKYLTFNLTAFPSEIAGSKIETISVIIKDLTHVVEEKDKQISKLYLDHITDLPNRHALIKKLNEEEANLCLMIISVDEFKKYRHTYGYQVADEILLQIAQELNHFPWQKNYKKGVYKLEEELFALTISKEEGISLALLKTEALKIVDYFNEFVVNTDDISIDVTVTIGANYTKKTDLLHETLIALDVANSTKKYCMFFDDLLNPQDKYKKNILMQQKVKKALEQDKVVPYFQPIVNEEKEVIKYESLARVLDPDKQGAIIPPLDFLQVIKDSKNYEKFTKTIIKQAFEALECLKRPVSINLSFEDITNPEIINFLEKKLQNYLNSGVTIELLESESLQDKEKTRHFCFQMKKYGAKIAIDDFGAGYSNYEYFFEMPMDILKIDGLLIKKVNDYKGYLLLESIIKFAKKLEIDVVAEYVEDEATFQKLKILGIDYFQGFYFDRPKPLNEICQRS